MSNTPRRLTRAQLSEFLPDPRAVRAFEQLLKQVSDLLPADVQTILAAIDDVAVEAASADARAAQCLDALNRIADALEVLATAPAGQQAQSIDDLAPPIQIGTLGQQQRDNVSITGGSVTANLTNNQNTLMTSSATLSNGAGAATATLTNAPAAGNPTKWVAINDNGTTRRIPTW